jgi:hypothetical protein
MRARAFAKPPSPASGVEGKSHPGHGGWAKPLPRWHIVVQRAALSEPFDVSVVIVRGRNRGRRRVGGLGTGAIRPPAQCRAVRG